MSDPAARRRAVRLASAVLAVVLGVSGGVYAPVLWRQWRPPLMQQTVAVSADGTLVEVHDPAARLVPGTRVLADGATAAARADGQREWLRRGSVPSPPELDHTTLVADALLDLHTLARWGGVPVAGWTDPWRYVWPRDSAFVASAYARTGHLDDAVDVLRFLQRVQSPDGLFQARHRTDGTVPDDRGVQLDGTGWSLWAVGEVVRRAAPPERQRIVTELAPLITRSTDAVIRLTAAGRALPPASPDYWETEAAVTLATCAVLLAGLRSAADLYPAGSPRWSEPTSAADAFADTVLHAFDPSELPRRPGGAAASVDLGASLLLDPFAGVADPVVARTWRAAPTYLRRPAGGLAPGGSWRRDGVSWTPMVATRAVAAACVPGSRDEAVNWLRWLDRHRTTLGSLPEKVRADGEPASVAPLAWTSAAVVIAADELDRGCVGD